MATVLLLHYLGANGSTTFTDATGRHTVTANGTAQISTSFPWGGEGSGLFDGTAPTSLTLDGSSDFAFGTGDFTIETFVRTPLGADGSIIDFGFASGNIEIYHISGGTLNFFAAGADRISSNLEIPANAIYHIAAARRNGLTQLFANGKTLGSYVDTNNYTALAGYPRIGNDTTIFFNGRMYETRIIKGFAAYTGNYTVPAAPFSPDIIEPRTPLYIPIRGYDHHIQLRTWIGTNPPVAVVANPFSQDDWPLPTPPRQFDLRTITASYNPNLVGQDKLPVGDTTNEVPKGYEFSIQLRQWSWKYILELIGQDQLPVGEIRTELTVKPYDYHIQLRDWRWNYNLNLIGKDRLPTGKFGGDLPPIGYPYPIDLRTITETYNYNLIGQDKLPVGMDIIDLPPQPAQSAIQLRTWIQSLNLALNTTPAVLPFNQYIWPLSFAPQPATPILTVTYNPNLIGQDKLPTGEVITDLPPRGYEYATFLRAWVLNLQQSTLQPIPYGKPFYDRPTLALVELPRSWTWNYNLNLIGKDQLPTGEIVSDLPPQPALSAIQLRTWINSVNLALVTTPAILPFNQYSWPINPGPQQPISIFTASYNRNLVGQDRLPFRQQDWPLPTPNPRSLDLVSWIDRAKSYLQRPGRQLDWPIPRGYQQPIQTFTASYNLNLIGKDQLPVGEVVTDIPPQPALSSIQLRTWIQALNLALTVAPIQRPFNQYDWPVNPGPRQPIQVFTSFYNRNLIGKDKLPFRQQDWPLPRDPRRLSDWILATNPNRFRPTPPIPFNQYQWPLPRTWTPGFEQRYSFAFQGSNIYYPFTNPIPPPPTPTPPEDKRIAWNAGNEWQMLDRVREPGPVGWR